MMLFTLSTGMGRNFFPGFGIFLQLIIFIIFLGIIYFVVKKGEFASDSAENILKKRLAKGEITKKEFQELKKEIGDR
jgi:putative membrane protein